MKQPPFLTPADEAKVLETIRQAEAGTTGEIRICVGSTAVTDVQASARQAFERLGMHQTRDRNGVLIYLAPPSRTLAIVGDSGIHQHGGDAFWSGIADQLSRDFAAGTIAAGLERAIREIGAALGRHFPRTEGDTNELPDSIASDSSV
jgi:uncharacterized membrane protein